MKENKKSLQKLTDQEIKIQSLLGLERITENDVKILDDKGKELFYVQLTKIFNELKGYERDTFWQKIEPISAEITKNQLWEYNHNQITWAISTLMNEFGRMPTKTEIAEKAQLSRQTIHKHLKEYTGNAQYSEQIEQFRFMSSKVLAKIFYFAVNGDMTAAKLYFNIVGGISQQVGNSTLIQNQNNYIQINGTVLSQETIKTLNPDQLKSIEVILQTVLPQPHNVIANVE